MKKAVMILLAGILSFQTFGGILYAEEKTVQINIQGCWT